MQHNEVRQDPQTADGQPQEKRPGKKLELLFKSFSILGLLSGLIPVVYTVNVIPGIFSGRTFLLFFLNALVILPVGYLEAKVVQRCFYDNARENSPLRILGAVVSILLGLASAAAAWFTYPQAPFDNGRGLVTLAFMLLVNFFLYHIGRQIFYRDYYNLLSSRLAIGVGVVYGAACCVQLLASNLFHMEYSLGPIVPFFFLFILAYLLTRNQGSLEYLVERRKNASTNLPNRIRRYNMLLLVILVAAVFVLFLLQDFIGAGIEQLLHLLRSLLTGLVQLYLWLVGLFSSEDTETVIGEESMMESQPITGESPSGSAFWDVLTVLLIAAGAVLLIRFLPNILRWIGRLLRSAYLKLVELASQGKEKDYGKEESNLYYSDDVETVLPQSVKSQSPWYDWRHNRALLKEIKREENPEKKIRMGYGFVRQLALDAGGEAWKLRASDSPRELSEKLKASQQPQTLENAGRIYASVRYGGRPALEQDALQVEQEAEAFLSSVKDSKLIKDRAGRSKKSAPAVNVRKRG